MEYEYVISAGPGTLIDHGTCSDVELFIKIMRVMRHGHTLMFSPVTP